MTTETTIVQDADAQDYTPAGAVTAGKIVQMPDGRAGAVITTLAASQLGAVRVKGIRDAVSDTSVLFDVGEDVWWDISAATAIQSKDADVGDFPIGVATVAKISGDLKVRVDLNAVSGRSQLLFAIVAAGTALTAATAETVLATYRIPANALKAGDALAVLAQVIATATHSTDTFRFRLRLGGVAGALLADSGAIDLADNDTGILKAEIVVRDTGATGHVVAVGESRLKTTNAHTTLGSTAVDTTATQTVVLTGEISTADAGNSCRADLFNVVRR